MVFIKCRCVLSLNNFQFTKILFFSDVVHECQFFLILFCLVYFPLIHTCSYTMFYHFGVCDSKAKLCRGAWMPIINQVSSFCNIILVLNYYRFNLKHFIICLSKLLLVSHAVFDNLVLFYVSLFRIKSVTETRMINFLGKFSAFS